MSLHQQMTCACLPLGATSFEGEVMLSRELRGVVEEMRLMGRMLIQTPSTLVDHVQAAKQMGLKPSVLLRRVRMGTLSAESWGGKTYILARDIRLGAKHS